MNFEELTPNERISAVRVAETLLKLSEKFQGFAIDAFDFDFDPDRGASSRGEKCEMVTNPSFEVGGLTFSYDGSDETSESIENIKLEVLEAMESDLWNETVGTEALKRIIPNGMLSVNELRKFISSVRN